MKNQQTLILGQQTPTNDQQMISIQKFSKSESSAANLTEVMAALRLLSVSCFLILKRLYVHKPWTLNYIANVHRVGNVHDYVILFHAMFTNPVDNVHDFMVLFRVMSTTLWFSSVLCSRIL